MSATESLTDAYAQPPLTKPTWDGRPSWIESTAELDRACGRWRASGIVSVDTEFVRERTFFPALGLVQISAGSPEQPEVALIDAVTIDDLSPLADLLSDSRVLKIMHAAGEDMSVFQCALDTLPTPVFDTQIGAALAGIGFALGYGALVDRLFDLNLPKEAQRTNWLRRPLSEVQLEYAASDVLYLPAIHRHLHYRLDAEGRVGWVLEDSQGLADEERLLPDPESVWRKVKGGDRISAAGGGALEALAAWREHEARRRNLPRGFVLRDDALVELAEARPRTAAELNALGAVPDKAKERYGAAVLRVLEGAPHHGTPRPPRPSYDPRSLVKTLQSLVAERARDLDIPAEILASRKHLESVLRRVDLRDAEPLPLALRGWRRPVIGDALVGRARTLLPRPAR